MKKFVAVLYCLNEKLKSQGLLKKGFTDVSEIPKQDLSVFSSLKDKMIPLLFCLR